MKAIELSFACALVILICLSAEGETGSGVNGTIGNLPAGKAIIFSHSVTVSGGTSATEISSQGTVAGSNFSMVLTDDPAVGGATDPTVTGVQQAPALTSIAKDVTEDIPESFAATEFDVGFSDLNAGDTLQVLRITSLPSKGVLKQEATPILSAPVDIPRASIADLSYDPDENEEGVDSFGWNASDGAVFAAGASVNLTIAGVNDPPTANPDTVERFPSQSVKFSAASLLVGDTDPEGNTPLVVVGVNYTGGNGASVTLSSGTIFYAPNGHLGSDSFEYTVEDALGASSTGTVTVAILVDNGSGANVLAITPVGPGVEVLFAGIPGRSYRVQSNDTFPTPPWVDRATLSVGPQGRFTFSDAGPVPPTRMYRSVSP